MLEKDVKEMKEKYNLDDDQVYWWHWTLINDMNGDIDMMHQEFPSCPEEAFIASGNSVFDNNIINNRLRSVKEPIKVGDFEFEYDDTQEKGKKISNIVACPSNSENNGEKTEFKSYLILYLSEIFLQIL